MNAAMEISNLMPMDGKVLIMNTTQNLIMNVYVKKTSPIKKVLISFNDKSYHWNIGEKFHIKDSLQLYIDENPEFQHDLLIGNIAAIRVIQPLHSSPMTPYLHFNINFHNGIETSALYHVYVSFSGKIKEIVCMKPKCTTTNSSFLLR